MHQDRDQDQDFHNSISRRLETKTQVSRTPSLILAVVVIVATEMPSAQQ